MGPFLTNDICLVTFLCMKSHVQFEILTSMPPALLESSRYLGLIYHPLLYCLLCSSTKRLTLLPQTVDTYYRRCSSANYVGNVSVPLLCISALDDPLCTAEAIPWDECRCSCSYCFYRCFLCCQSMPCSKLWFLIGQIKTLCWLRQSMEGIWHSLRD